eukprot:TRINITY_DN55427_c0_g1_i1.p2 TRINITY_DN55427_c0_g1~~TRINITY_DN55427_c0_g1_i1.p2  ORF type:complete len:225 (-),score=95.19 TRINITY_DN55427_c0_g1_i1:56-637(-)
MAPLADAGEEDIFYVSEQGLALLRRKVDQGEAIDRGMVDVLAFPGDVADDQVVVPVDLGILDADFGDDEEDLISEDFRLDVGRLVQRLGAKGAAEAILRARDRYEEASRSKPEADRMKPMTAKQWKDLMELGDDDFPEGEGEEEELCDPDGTLSLSDGDMEGEEEEDGDGDEEEDAAAPPAAKRAKTGGGANA